MSQRSSSRTNISPSRILSAAYLEKHSSKNDLVRRLRTVGDALQHDNVEPDSHEYPGLAGLASLLVQPTYLHHRDKEVRLHTVLACMEVFYLYAPEPPWDESEILRVFAQMIRQLANLAHTTSPDQTNFHHYSCILEQLATVKVGVVLVELTKTLDSDQSRSLGGGGGGGGGGTITTTTTTGGGNPHKRGGGDDVDDEDEAVVSSEEALETLADLIRTILTCVNIDHPTQIHNHAVAAVSACIDEFDSTLPIPILDELLTCIAGGPTVYVTNPAAVEAAAKAAAAAAAQRKKSKKTKSRRNTTNDDSSSPPPVEKMPPLQIQQTNPSYMVAAAIIRRTLDKISTPTATLLNGLLNGDTNIVSQTNISSAETSSSTNDKTPAAFVTSATKEDNHHKLLLQQQQPQLSSTLVVGAADVWTIVYELHRISPPILTTVIGTVANSLEDPELPKRLRVTKLLGRLFYAPISNIGVQFGPCYREWIRRSQDIEPKVRLAMVKYLVTILTNKGQEPIMAKEASGALVKMMEHDPLVDVRLSAIHQVCDLAYNAAAAAATSTSASSNTHNNTATTTTSSKALPLQSGTSHASTSTTTTTTTAWVSPRLLQAVGNRVSSKNKTERRDALTGLAQIYFRHYVLPKLRSVQNGGDDCDIGVILDALQDTTTTLSGSQSSFGGVVSPRRSKGGGGNHRRGKRKSSSLLSFEDDHEYHNDDDDDDDDLSSGDIMDEKYRWIPRKVFESACFTDATDPDMRNRVIQIMDDLLLGAAGTSTTSSKDGKQPKKDNVLTPTSKAVGLAFVIDSLRDEDNYEEHSRSSGGGGGSGLIQSNAFKWMCQLFLQRANLQRAVRNYMEARANLKKYAADTEEALKADADAMECLEKVAALTAPVGTSGSNSSSSSDVHGILEKFHGARDKHIFRILATIANSTHSAPARARAFDELPKRSKALGDSTAAWVKTLARRCAMGNFVNVENINHCILLAQECFHEEDLPSCKAFLTCIQMAVTIYPTLCGTDEGFGTLVELFGECRTAGSGKWKKEIEASGIVTILSSILAVAAPARAAHFLDDKTTTDKSKPIIDPDLQAQLMNLCTRDGTPQQAKFAVYTMASLLNPTATARSGMERSGIEKEHEAFDPLLKALTSPTRLSLPSGSSEKSKIVCVLAALAALADCAPSVFGKASGRGTKAIRFALETILLGRSSSGGDDDLLSEDDQSSDEDTQGTPTSIKSRRKSKGRRSETASKRGGEGYSGILDDSSLAVATRRACASIEFLVSHIRSTITKMSAIQTSQQSRTDQDKENQQHPVNRRRKEVSEGKNQKKSNVNKLESPSSDHIKQVFGILTQILQDNGLPPSSRDRRDCRASADRAALRQCAAVNLVRLCDARLKLEKAYLSPAMWQVLSGTFLDEEVSVRESVMDELRQMLVGQGKYQHAPSLRFVSLVALCTDGDHGAGHYAANGNAAHVGKRSVTMKGSALQCITSLRKTCDLTLAQCRARGAERIFEERYKMLLMPEFAVPFALHLLSFRRETPSAGGTAIAGILTQPNVAQTEEEDDDTLVHAEESRHKVLKKRLKWLFEPLVQSLGEGADNISFLMRMTEMLGNNYHPVDVMGDANKSVIARSPRPSFSPSVDHDSSFDWSRGDVSPVVRARELSAAKLKIVCMAAREVLLSFVKKDVNLTPYPGDVQIPASLFKKNLSSSARLSQSSQASVSLNQRESIDSLTSNKRTPKPARLTIERENQNTGGSRRKSHVHFSPEVDHGGEVFTFKEDDAVVGDDASPVIQRRKGKKRRTPLSAKDDNDQVSEDNFGGLSPIRPRKSLSPSRYAKSKAISEETMVKNLSTTPPSILRSHESDGRPSLSSVESDNSSLVLTRRSRRLHVTKEQDDSILSKTPSVSQSSQDTSLAETEEGVENNSISESLSQKRKSPDSSNGGSEVKRRKKASPIQIKVGSGSKLAKKGSTSSARGLRKRRSKTTQKSPEIVDEFDFADDDDINGRKDSNPPSSRSRKKKQSIGKAKTRKHSRNSLASISSLDTDASAASQQKQVEPVKRRSRRIRA